MGKHEPQDEVETVEPPGTLEVMRRYLHAHHVVGNYAKGLPVEQAQALQEELRQLDEAATVGRVGREERLHRLLELMAELGLDQGLD